MSGRRNVMDSAGNAYEDCAASLMGRITSLVRVPREKDFGIDFYCQPLIADGPQTETVAELCSLQVKGGRQKLEYGGLNRHGEWRQYEFDWLRSLATPLYLARVKSDCSAVELFSLWPLWWIFWNCAPFRVVLAPRPAGPGRYRWQPPRSSPDPNGVGQGDGMRWTVDLGPPFLRLSNEDLNNPEFRKRAVAVLRTWVGQDRLTLMRYLQSVPVVTGITCWSTCPPEVFETGISYFWNSQPGRNIAVLCATVAPMVVNLVVHLQWQNDHAAYRFLPVLEWLEARGELDPLGKGLLESLRKTQAIGVGPRGDPVNLSAH
jgi:hypothetical protein